MPKHFTRVTDKSFTGQAVRLWNDLPELIRHANLVYILKAFSIKFEGSLSVIIKTYLLYIAYILVVECMYMYMCTISKCIFMYEC